jgi:hypothetical protein
VILRLEKGRGVRRSVIALDSELGPKLGPEYESGGCVRYDGVGMSMLGLATQTPAPSPLQTDGGLAGQRGPD